MNHPIRLIVLALLFSASIEAVCAGGIEDNLRARIEADPDEFYSVLVVMNHGTKAVRLSQSLELDRYTREAGHAIAMRHLKQNAEASQRDLLEYLGAQSALKNVESYRGFWIDNIVGVTAKGSLLLEISGRHDVEAVIEIGAAPLIEPVEYSYQTGRPAEALPSALKVIGADSMWSLGYTGAGRLVCSFDTGIDGTHPALYDSWRGNNGYTWQESWFDPVACDSFPHTTIRRPEHGTHTMGIMVAHDDLTGDTIGVAPDAQWISAAVIDILVSGGRRSSGQDIIAAFEWAADPDGNPNTVTDVPDVVSHSWGYPNNYSGCEDVFWRLIDNLEALGAVCVFACGNEGTAGAETIRNPANRASSPYNTFAVGMIDPSVAGFPVHPESSRGPSDCDGISLKPQVVAPGVNIRSTFPVVYGSYGYITGTSMACPYVAGAVALLRQYNPNAPADSIKKALIETAIDVDAPGPDLKSGHGMIYIPAALEALAPINEPSVFISETANYLADPGSAIKVTLSLGNSGLGLADVHGTLRSLDPVTVTVTDSTFFFGSIPSGGESDNSSHPFEAIFDSDIVPGTDVTLILHVTGSDGYIRDIPLFFLVGERPSRATFVHNIGNVAFGGSNYGHYGFAPGSISDLGLPGFIWPNDGSGENHLFEMGLLVATGPGRVSDNVLNPLHVPDDDFRVGPGGGLEFHEPGEFADQESFSVFDDSRAEHPIGVRISQRTLAFADSPHDDYVMIILDILNTSGGRLSNLHVAILTDWDWPFGGETAGSSDRVGFEASADLGYMYDSKTGDCRGVAVLSREGATGFRAIRNEDYIWDRDGGTDREKWEFMTGGIVDTSSYLLYPDHSCLIATGPFSLQPGGWCHIAFAIMGAASPVNLISTAGLAGEKYEELRASSGDTVPPSFSIDLLPNPVLSFELDVIAFPSEPILQEPIAIIASSGAPDTIPMTQLGDRDALTYSCDYQVDRNDNYTISICGTDTVGNHGCSQTGFSAAPVTADRDILIVGQDNRFSLYMPANSFSRDALLICRGDSTVADDPAGLKLPPGTVPVYMIRAASGIRKLGSSATLTVRLDRLGPAEEKYGSVVLLHVTGQGRREVPVTLDSIERVLTAEIAELGSYLVALSSGSDGSSNQDNGGMTPSQFRLDQNHPNPFNAGTTISFELRDAARVTLAVYNILGRKVITLLNEHLSAGSHDIFWDGRDADGGQCGSGVYFYRIEAGAFTDTKRMLLLK